MYWSPQLKGRSFQKARNFIADIVTSVTLDQSFHINYCTKMEDLASEFSTVFRDVILPDDLLPHPTPSPAFCRARGAKRLSVGTQTLVPLNFSAVVAPLTCTAVTVY